MPLTWTVGGVDKSSAVRYEGWSLTECAMRGQVGTGTVIIDDTLGTYLPPAQKAATVAESSSATPLLFSGYVAERVTSTSPQAPGQRQWQVTFEDLNVLIDDRIIAGSDGNRPAETDRARILWLLSDPSMGSITSGVLHAVGDNVDMDAVDYRGKRPRDVLEDCSQKSGANYFIYEGSATTTSAPKLFYDIGSNPSWTSTIYLSDSAADVDSSTVFAVVNPELSYDPSRVYSRVRVRYKQGSTTAWSGVTGSNFRVREVYKRYMRTKTEPKAQQQADKWLDHAGTETRSLAVSVILPAASVNLVRAGHLIGIKLTRHGFTGYENWRVTQRTISPLNDVTYLVTLTLKDKVKPTRFFEGPDVSVDEEFSNATNVSTPDAPGVVIDAGSITVRNTNGTTVIDGSSEFWSILASGSITLPASSSKGTTKKSIELTIANVTTDPVTYFAATTDARDGTGKWGQFLPMFDISASGVILRAIQGRARYASGTGSNTKVAVQVTRFSATTSDGSQVIKYWVMDKRSL